MILESDEQRYFFRGAYDNDVELILYPQHIEDAGHVVILAVYGDYLLFAKHKTRGLEWVSGKVENGEDPLQAACRELLEETGGVASSLWLVGQYKVCKAGECLFIKNIYVAAIQQIKDQLTGTDSFGYELLPLDIQPSSEAGFSPLVTDSLFSIVTNAVFKRS